MAGTVIPQPPGDYGQRLPSDISRGDARSLLSTLLGYALLVLAHMLRPQKAPHSISPPLHGQEATSVASVPQPGRHIGSAPPLPRHQHGPKRHVKGVAAGCAAQAICIPPPTVEPHAHTSLPVALGWVGPVVQRELVRQRDNKGTRPTPFATETTKGATWDHKAPEESL